MFHTMPGVAGLQLQERVFPVLVISARSTPANSTPSTTRHSWTVQLPIDFDSFSSDPYMERKSYMRRKPSDKYLRYDCPPETTRDLKGHGGNKLTVGKYVSLERLSQTQSGGYRWDMVRLRFSTAYLKTTYLSLPSHLDLRLSPSADNPRTLCC
jgi:hypothetical protein